VTSAKKKTKTLAATTLRRSNTLDLPDPVGGEDRQRGHRDQQQLKPIEERHAEQSWRLEIIERDP
jgi:hypothetical protein